MCITNVYGSYLFKCIELYMLLTLDFCVSSGVLRLKLHRHVIGV